MPGDNLGFVFLKKQRFAATENRQLSTTLGVCCVGRNVVFLFMHIAYFSSKRNFTICNQRCRRQGCRGCKRSPKRFDLLKMRENLGKTYENVRKIPENTGKNGAQRCLILKNLRPTCDGESHEHLFLEVIPKKDVNDLCRRKYSHKDLPENRKSFRTSLGEFGQKSFASPKICLLLHLCLQPYSL